MQVDRTVETEDDNPEVDHDVVPEKNVWFLVGWAMLHHLTLAGNRYVNPKSFHLCLLSKAKIPEDEVREIRLVQLHLSDYMNEDKTICSKIVQDTILEGTKNAGTKLYNQACKAYMNRRMASIFNIHTVDINILLSHIRFCSLHIRFCSSHIHIFTHT